MGKKSGAVQDGTDVAENETNLMQDLISKGMTHGIIYLLKVINVHDT